jgi:hypothetical protein
LQRPCHQLFGACGERWNSGQKKIHEVEIYDYIKLDLNDRANLLWDEGVFIEKYIDLHIITNLYYLDKFYVEVVLSNKDGRISEITPFKSGDRLEKYIRHVDLKMLI